MQTHVNFLKKFDVVNRLKFVDS